MVLKIGKSSLTVKVEEWIIEGTPACLVFGCRPICLRVVAILKSMTARKNHDTLVRVLTHEFFDGASHLDVGWRLFAVEFVTSVEVVNVLVTHVAPSQTARIVQTHEAFALVIAHHLRPVGSVLTQLVELHTKPIGAHQFVSITVGNWRNFLCLAELWERIESFTLSNPSVESITTWTVVVTLTSAKIIKKLNY